SSSSVSGGNHMAPVLVIRGAGALGRYHWRAQWIFRRASYGKCGAVHGLLQTLEHLCADALGGLFRRHFLRPKYAVGVEFRIFFPQVESTVWNSADPAPL